MSKRILVVEDQEDNRQILRDVLGSAGYEMTEAWDGEASVSAAKEQRPDLILMDIQLPLVDGYEATRRIKADPERSAGIAAEQVRVRDQRQDREGTRSRNPGQAARASRRGDRIGHLCRTAYVCFWHKADIAARSIDVRFRG
jgi:CheY-like chemotaxis protein